MCVGCRAIGTIGYAGLGDDAPGNLLTGFGFYQPWCAQFCSCKLPAVLSRMQLLAVSMPHLLSRSDHAVCRWLLMLANLAIVIHLVSPRLMRHLLLRPNALLHMHVGTL